MPSRNIAVLGAGNVGAALARIWSKAGHSVSIGVPDPNSASAQKAKNSIAGVRVTTNREAVEGASVVALCVPWEASEQAIRESGDLKDKILLDCVNPLKPDLSGLAIGTDVSAAEQTAQLAVGAKVVKAFNTIGAPCYGNAQFGSERASGFYCGDDAEAKAAVRELIADAALDPVDVGPLRNARWLEAMAMLWIDLAINQKQGVNHAFKLLRR
ncbi:MAG TPA: NADPH-dependent F420 reductase [Bryobacteraceae bacterium]|jgi:predicted dinucleotide-binding enzyme|nr:NADPH-dependent F420 reductase [Bryobacteraceae bacterium]